MKKVSETFKVNSETSSVFTLKTFQPVYQIDRIQESPKEKENQDN